MNSENIDSGMQIENFNLLKFNAAFEQRRWTVHVLRS